MAKMKSFCIVILCLFCGCVTSPDIETINILDNRLSNIEKRLNTNPPKIIPTVPHNIYSTPHQTSPHSNKILNDAQKDFVEFMLDYLSNE